MPAAVPAVESCSCTMAASASVCAQRKQQRHDNFLAGKARSAHRLPESLERSIAQESSAPDFADSSQHRSCKRGCTHVLRGLKDAFEAAGLHPAKDHQKRVASYPIPKKQKVAHRNIRGVQ